MRQFLKITLVLALLPALVSSTAFGQNRVNTEQHGGSTADIKQMASNGKNIVRGLKGGSITHGDALTQMNGSFLKVRQKVEQLGNGSHEMGLRQTGKSGQYAELNQKKGTNNRIYLRQETKTKGNHGNRALIVQNGSDVVEGTKGKNTSVDFPKFDSKPARQTGKNNRLEVYQRGGQNTLIPQQIGNKNKLRLNQKNNSYAEVLQEGSRNTVAEKRGGGGTFQSKNANLYVQQKGHGNSVFGKQAASSKSFASLVQSGSGNSMSLVQR
jgi:hypothetical protein